jgi:TatA/E family protein of Tat protein translocase
MNFLDVGPLEILLILIIALIIFGPGRLPQIAAAIGKGLRKLKEATTELSKDFQGMADDVKDAGKETKGAAGPGGGLAGDLREVTGEIAKEIKDVGKDFDAALKGDAALTGEIREVGRGVQDVAKEITTALKPDAGSLQGPGQGDVGAGRAAGVSGGAAAGPAAGRPPAGGDSGTGRSGNQAEGTTGEAGGGEEKS